MTPRPRDCIRLLSSCPAVCRTQSKLDMRAHTHTHTHFNLCPLSLSPSLCQESSASDVSEHFQGCAGSAVQARELPAESELQRQGQHPASRQLQPRTTLPQLQLRQGTHTHTHIHTDTNTHKHSCRFVPLKSFSTHTYTHNRL